MTEHRVRVYLDQDGNRYFAEQAEEGSSVSKIYRLRPGSKVREEADVLGLKSGECICGYAFFNLATARKFLDRQAQKNGWKMVLV